jgi:hypothetical protein
MQLGSCVPCQERRWRIHQEQSQGQQQGEAAKMLVSVYWEAQ